MIHIFIFFICLSVFQINSNGHLSFDSDMPHYRATALVLPIEFNVIAAFLADIDITNGIGDIYYRYALVMLVIIPYLIAINIK